MLSHFRLPDKFLCSWIYIKVHIYTEFTDNFLSYTCVHFKRCFLTNCKVSKLPPASYQHSYVSPINSFILWDLIFVHRMIYKCKWHLVSCFSPLDAAEVQNSTCFQTKLVINVENLLWWQVNFIPNLCALGIICWAHPQPCFADCHFRNSLDSKYSLAKHYVFPSPL